MKDSYYFPHDYHARHDPKNERMRMDIGPVGEGIYWDLVEMLYEQNGYLSLQDIPLFAKSLNTTEELIKKVINDYDLFSKNGDKFYSESLLIRLKHINIKRRKARTSAKLSHSADAQRTHSQRTAIKESKVKESKEKDIKEQQASPALRAALDKVYKDINIYALMNKLKKQLKWPETQNFPEEVLLKVCTTYNKGQVKDEWAWFTVAIKKASEEYFAEQNIKTNAEFKKSPMAQSIKEILGINLTHNIGARE